MIRPGHLDSIKMITITCWNINWSLLLISLLICTFPRNKNSPSPRDWYRNLFDLCQEPSRPRFISIAPPHSLRGITPFDLRSAFVKKNTIGTIIVRGSQKHSLGQSEGRESLKQMVKRTLLGFVLRWIIRLHFRESSGAWESKRELWKDYTNFHPTSAALKPLLQNLFSPRKDAIAFLQTLFLVGYCVHIEIMIHPCQATFAGEPLIEPLMSVYGENSKVHLIREIISQIIKMEI